jgi:type II secretory pathway component GspD/PulD (secretin)
VVARMHGEDINYNPNSTSVVTNGVVTINTTFNPQVVPIDLVVIPKISLEDNKVEMLVTFSLTTVNGTSPGNGAPAPTTSQRVDTTILVSNSETAVIGGLTKDSLVKTATKVPVLGDIPLLGLLFKGEKSVKTKADIIVFITPSIVED